MDFSNLLEILGPFKDQVEHFYSISSLVISIVFILWVFNLVAGFIHKTYLLGRTFGIIYKKYIHNFFSKIAHQVFQYFKPNEKVNDNMQNI